jgi:hypothetical protein
MTIFEIAHGLPNGFHDAEVETIHIDYSNRTLQMALSVWLGSMDDPPSVRETYRKGVLTVTGFQYCAMDVPKEGYLKEDPGALTIDLYQADNFVPPPPAFACRLWVNEWCGYIHLSAVAAELVWQGEPTNRGHEAGN